MEDPPSSPPVSSELPRICPHCKRPVAPGYKFCEVCGTRIPSLFTCSKCGTQFVHLKKYCDVCGALFVPKEVLEPEAQQPAPEEEVPGPEAEEVTEPGGEIPEQEPEEIPEPEEEEEIAAAVVRKKTKRSVILPVPEPGEEPAPEEAAEAEPEEEAPAPVKKKRKKPAKTIMAEEPEEMPKPGEEERLAPVEKKRQKQYSREIREPPTEEILREFGEHEPEDEAAKKGRKGLFGFLKKKQQKQPVNPDEALFLPDKAPARKKSRGFLKWIAVIIVIAAILGAVYFFGLSALTGLFAGIAPSSGEETPTPVPTTTTPGVTPTRVPGALTTLPTETIPSGQKFYFLVQKHPVTSKISVIFTGSAGGDDGIVSAEVRVTHPDGSVSYGNILPLKSQVDISVFGSNGTDRVEIIAKMANGETFRVYDELFPGPGST